MIAFMSEAIIPRRDHYQVLDLFGGMARITKLARALSLAAACLDKELSSSLDMNTDAGFVLPTSNVGKSFTCT